MYVFSVYFVFHKFWLDKICMTKHFNLNIEEFQG